MNYADIINLIFSILTGIVSILYIPFLIFGVIGLFKKKKFPKAKVQHRYGIIIPARNEEKVVGNLIESIRKNNYPQDKLDIIVMAHNCTDKTAEVARRYEGVKVYEYNNDNERTKGYGLKYLFEQLKKDLPNGIEEYDGYFMFDADNLVEANYFDKMNDAFDANGENAIITSFRNSKNFGSNAISGMYGVYFLYACRFGMRGRAVCNVSSRVCGTGIVFSSKAVKDGWKYVTLTEDLEFTADQLIDNHKIIYCDDAQTFDEQPISFKVMWRQRVRWARGHLVVFATRLKDVFKNLFAKKSYKVSTFDLAANLVPTFLIYGLLWVAQFALLLFAPLTGLALWPVLNSALLSLCWTLLTGYVTMVLTAAIMFIAERKRIQNVSPIKMFGIALIFPFFMALQFPIDFVAMCSKNLTWKTIPHVDTTNVSSLKDTKTE